MTVAELREKLKDMAPGADVCREDERTGELVEVEFITSDGQTVLVN